MFWAVNAGCMPAFDVSNHYVRAAAAAKHLGVDTRTLVVWANAGYIKCVRPGGTSGHRLYDVSSVGARPIAATAPCPVESSSDRVDGIYARVSTRKQLPNLERQLQHLQSKHPGCTVFRDCASGLNFKRKGLQALLELAFKGRLRKLHIAHRDRLCRFAYDLLEHILTRHGVQVVVDAHDEDPTPEQDLADDVLQVITVFGARLYGKRSGGRRRADGSIREQAVQETNGGTTDGNTAIEHGRQTQSDAV